MLWEQWVVGNATTGGASSAAGDEGKRLHARYCSPACTRRARYARWVAAGRPYRGRRWATAASGAVPGGSRG
jgi:hypothetical protein